MKEIIKMIVQVIHIISICGSMLSLILGAVYEIIGYAKFERMLSAIGVSKGVERFWVISAIMLVLLITTYFIKTKLFSRLK